MRIVVLVLIALLMGGCFEDEGPPPAFATNNVAADTADALSVPSCAADPSPAPTDYQGLVDLLEGDVNDENDGVTGELARAQRWNKAADDRVKDLLARYTPALTVAQQNSFADAYETLGIAYYDGKGKPVAEVRT